MTELTHHSFSTDPVPDHVKVGKYSSIASGVFFHDPHDNHFCIENRKCVYTTKWNQEDSSKGPTVIGNDVWIGRNAKILYGVHIGDGAIIGAHAVIAKDVPPYAVVVGNPQTIKRFRFDAETIKRLLTLKWWDLTDPEVEALKEYMADVDVFILKAQEHGHSI